MWFFSTNHKFQFSISRPWLCAPPTWCRCASWNLRASSASTWPSERPSDSGFLFSTEDLTLDFSPPRRNSSDTCPEEWSEWLSKFFHKFFWGKRFLSSAKKLKYFLKNFVLQIFWLIRVNYIEKLYKIISQLFYCILWNFFLISILNTYALQCIA